jgi:ABC-type Zn uptake system ZnuABC Zn-binding protein ZnuA
MRAVLLLAWLFAAACSRADEPTAPVELQAAVATGAPVLTAWAEFLLEGLPIEVRALHGPAGATAGQIPSREQLRAAQSARLVALNGAGFESWLATAALPPSRTRATAEGLEGELLQTEERTHAHGGQGEHTHPAIDGRTWLDPELARAQAARLVSELAAAFPEQASALATRATELEERLLRSEAGLQPHRAALAACRVLAIHDQGYGYLARSWGGEVRELELGLKAKLGTADWNRVRAQLDGSGGLLLCPVEPAAELRAQLATEMRLVCVVFATGERAPQAGAWWQERKTAQAALIAGLEALFALRAAE